jgi:hypothetical protein
MKITPQIRAKRILEHHSNKRYYPIPEQDREKYLTDYCFQKDEQLLGIYKNDIKNNLDDVLFTDKGIHFYVENKKIFIAYNQIKDLHVEGEKITANTLLITYGDNGDQKIKLLIKGGEGKCRDIFEILRYLRRVMDDVAN